MNVELRDLITMGSLVVSIVAMLLLNKNAKRALRPAAENTDLTRIRDLRSELAEARSETREMKMEVDALKGQVHQLTIQVTAANDAATAAYQWRMEALNYARMPGVQMDDWLRRFDRMPPELNGRQG